MTREELLRILDYLDKMAKLNSGRAALADIDARWNIVAYTIRRHLQGKPLTITSLAAASGLPYGTAMRRIEGMVTEGLLMKRPRSKSGKSFS
ncbi:MAG: sugar ABC transporter substrate-binding protein, partial [Mesorhizobium sp.]|nr:sugar ABC transporter substrate-binding protein [Mesorhizobium sp.]